jgi:hypothetical protein
VLNVRTSEGRRLRDISDALASELGGWATLSETMIAAVRKAAELAVYAERLRHEALLGSKIDPMAVMRAENSSARAVRALGIKSRSKLTRLF